MAKTSHPGPSNGGMNVKTNPKFKWVRMLHVLDYHPWHQVKKLVPNKMHNNNGRKNIGININEPDGYEPYSIVEEENNENLQVNNIDEHTTNRSHSVAISPLNPNQQKVESASAKQAKRSRAKKLRKMIIKEVTKRSGKHRRSLTCPAASQLTEIDGSHSHQEMHNDESPTKNTKIEGQKCELCTARQIECHLGDKKHVNNEEGEQQIDQINRMFQEIKDVPNSRHNLGRSISFQHSKEFLDALDVLSVNKQFFLRVLDDPGPSLRDHFLTVCTKRKWLKKSETFPNNDPSGSTRCFPKLLTRDQNEENSFGVVGKRFKNIGQKIRHLIRESRKEQHRIAMDAVLHKVPYGEKVSQEIINNDNRPISMCEKDIPFSPCHIKDGKNYKKQLSSVDQSMDRYRQLMQSTSFNRNIQIEMSPDRLKLRVMDENSSKCAPRNLRRILSSPDLNVSFRHLYDDYNGYSSSRMPNLRLRSFIEQKDLRSVNLDGLEMCQSKMEDMPSNVDDKGYVTKDQSDSSFIDQNTLAAFDSGNDVKESSSIMESDLLTDLPSLDGKISEDLKQTQLAQGLLDESPTFASIKVDTNQAESTICSLFHSHQRLHVDNKDEAKFNYVKDILQVSGYSGNQCLGKWYSSEQPVDPSLFIELENYSLLEPECSASKEGPQSNHLLLFDLINEALLKIYERSVSYWPVPLSSWSRTHPMPKGYHVLEEVWACITSYMGCSLSEAQQPSDYITMRDLGKDDEWMNLQFDNECVALEIEEMIFQDFLNELVS